MDIDLSNTEIKDKIIPWLNGVNKLIMDAEFYAETQDWRSFKNTVEILESKCVAIKEFKKKYIKNVKDLEINFRFATQRLNQKYNLKMFEGRHKHSLTYGPILTKYNKEKLHIIQCTLDESKLILKRNDSLTGEI